MQQFRLLAAAIMPIRGVGIAIPRARNSLHVPNVDAAVPPLCVDHLVRMQCMFRILLKFAGKYPSYTVL